MHLAETPEEQKAWRSAAVALRQVKREELRAMTDKDAVAAFNSLDMRPELCWRNSEPANSEGLIKQQRIFKRLCRY